GMTATTGRAHLARAVFDAIAWSLADVVTAFCAAGSRMDELSVDGGLTRSPGLLQRCADILGVPLRISEQPGATAHGVPWLALLAAGEIDADAIRASARRGRFVDPERGPSPESRWGW